MILEQFEHRVLGAVRVVDAITKAQIRNPLTVEATGVTFVVNRSGLFVIYETPGIAELQPYTQKFEEPLEIQSKPILLYVRDRSGEYLPQYYEIALPRSPKSLKPKDLPPLFKPVDINLFRSPSAQIGSTWGVLYATVLRQHPTILNQFERLPWALITVTDENSKVIAITQADWRGEALIAIPKRIYPSSATTLDISLEVLFDPSLKTFDKDSDFMHLQDPNLGYVPDLNIEKISLWQRSQKVSYALIAGKTQSYRLIAQFV